MDNNSKVSSQSQRNTICGISKKVYEYEGLKFIDFWGLRVREVESVYCVQQHESWTRPKWNQLAGELQLLAGRTGHHPLPTPTHF